VVVVVEMLALLLVALLLALVLVVVVVVMVELVVVLELLLLLLVIALLLLVVMVVVVEVVWEGRGGKGVMWAEAVGWGRWIFGRSCQVQPGSSRLRPTLPQQLQASRWCTCIACLPATSSN
jgi:hypothetical protein